MLNQTKDAGVERQDSLNQITRMVSRVKLTLCD